MVTNNLTLADVSHKACLTPAEVSAILGISVKLVRREIRDKKIPHIKFGRIYMVPTVQLKALLEGK